LEIVKAHVAWKSRNIDELLLGTSLFQTGFRLVTDVSVSW
jgi:hypothetical protein